VAKKIISYKLLEDGTIPEYIIEGGHFASPDRTLIGFTESETDGIESFETKQDLLDYINTYAQNWETDLSVPFDLQQVVDYLWNKLSN